jgi:hypothetical protein
LASSLERAKENQVFKTPRGNALFPQGTWCLRVFICGSNKEHR